MEYKIFGKKRIVYCIENELLPDNTRNTNNLLNYL